jgi:hypothetical protein
MRSITIGCTFNLERYENLRVDVTDDDADRALALMCETLDRLGRSDPAASTAIDSYRQRVFGVSQTTGAHTGTQQESTGDAEDCEPEQIVDSPISEDTPAEKPAQKRTTERIIDPATLPRVCDKCGCELKESEAVASAVYANGAVRCVACRYPELDTESMFQKPKPNSDPTPATETAAITEPEREQPAKNPTPVNYACEECHVEIDKTQADVSQLFLHRDLCKECMYKQPTEREVPK